MPQAPSLRKDPFFTIFLKHLPSGQKVSFEGWVTEFSDQFNSNWQTTSVYGRMDPLPAFEGTQRTISMGFDVVSDNINDAVQNLKNINTLIEFLYPMYASGKRQRTVQNTLKAAPLLGLKWTNLVNNAAASEYLYGYINGGINYTPDMGEGGFVIRKQLGQASAAVEDQIVPDGLNPTEGSPPPKVTRQSIIREDSYIPKKISLSFTFNVLHTHLPGWDKEGVFGGNSNLTGRFPNANTVANTFDVVTTTTGNEEDIVVEDTFENDAANKALVLE